MDFVPDLKTMLYSSAMAVLAWFLGGRSKAQSAEATAAETLGRAYGKTIEDLERRLQDVEKHCELQFRREEILIGAMRANGIPIPHLPTSLEVGS